MAGQLGAGHRAQRVGRVGTAGPGRGVISGCPSIPRPKHALRVASSQILLGSVRQYEGHIHPKSGPGQVQVQARSGQRLVRMR